MVSEEEKKKRLNRAFVYSVIGAIGLFIFIKVWWIVLIAWVCLFGYINNQMQQQN